MKQIILTGVLIFVFAISGVNAQEPPRKSESSRQNDSVFDKDKEIRSNRADYKWKPYYSDLLKISSYSIFDLMISSTPSNYLQLDYISFRTKSINIFPITIFYLSDHFFSKYNPQIEYWLNFGYRIPIFCSEKHRINLNSNLFWLSRSEYESEYRFKVKPFVDSQVRYDFKYAFSAFAGYRFQLYDWNIGYDWDYSYTYFKLNGLYFGISIGLTHNPNSNKVYTSWMAAKSKNTPDSYEAFLHTFPNSDYTQQAIIRMENSAYEGATKGDTTKCDYYIAKYPAGKYIEDVKRLRIEEIERIESEFYKKAVNGTEYACDSYLEKYPNGKYSVEVKNLKSEKIERDLYHRALNGNQDDCDKYLAQYPSSAHSDQIKKLRDERYKLDELLAAFNSGDCEKLKELITTFEYSSLVGTNTVNALLLASSYGCDEVVKILVDKGIKPNIQMSSDGSTPLIIASQRGLPEVVKILLELQANINTKTLNGTTALHAAAQNGNIDVVMLLLRHGADTEIVNNEGKTALEVATNKDVRDLLLTYLQK